MPEQPTPEPPAPPPGGSSDDAVTQDAPKAVPLAALPASDLLTLVLSLLAAKAWEGMGLVASPLTGKVEKNINDARLAIDAYAAIFEVVRATIEEQARRDMENLLTTLRVNFVQKSPG